MQNRRPTSSDHTSSDAPAERAGWPRWALFALGYALLIAAWVFASPPGATPREDQHLIRAAAAGRGQFQGVQTAPFQPGAGLTAAQAQFWNEQSRQFTVPSGIVAPPACFAGAPDVSAACLNQQRSDGGNVAVAANSAVGAYPPFAYVPAGLAMRTLTDWAQATYAGRAVLAALSALLLALAGWALAARGSVWPLAGLALATTPTAIFLASGLSPAGLEVAAAIAFAAALVAVWRGQRPHAAAATLAVSGAVLAVAYPFGVVYVAVLAVAALPVIGLRFVRQGWTLLALLAVALAVVAGMAWLRVSQPSRTLAPDPVLADLGHAITQTPALVTQQIAVFGSLDTAVPAALTDAWLVLVLLLGAAALVLGLWRERLVLGLALVAAVAVAAALEGLVLSPAWPVQGKYLLPVLVLVPIVCGSVLDRVRVLPRWDVFLLGLAVAGLQFGAFWFAARRYAVGQNGPLVFTDTAQWLPPQGWLPWLVLAGAGCLMLALSLVPLTSSERAAVAEQEGMSRLVMNPRISLSR
jgi:hypothetical protein